MYAEYHFTLVYTRTHFCGLFIDILLYVQRKQEEQVRKHEEQVLLNNQLVSEISELQQEAQLIREIPQRLGECAATCKDIYVDVLSTTQVTADFLLRLSQSVFVTVQFANLKMIWAELYI